MSSKNTLLEVRNLKTYFYTYRGVVKALEGVNLKLGYNEIMGLVGETGSGKSVTALSIMRLINPPGKILSGEIIFDGRDLLKLSKEEMREIRGKEISMIFQEPRAALNPVMRVGDQIAEAIETHEKLKKEELKNAVIDLLKKVGLPDPDRLINQYPHELSGGMAQRVVIAMAIAFKPKLLIADEPTSSLDVTIQAQILDLLEDLVSEMGSSVLFITHNLGVAAELCNKISVMYAGTVVESCDTYTIFDDPLHPYTVGLIKAVPKMGQRGELYVIEGELPDLVNPPPGCRFHPRCPKAMEICKRTPPKTIEIKPGHVVACHLYNEG